MVLGTDNRVVGFDEKPARPSPMPGRDDVALVSMGIYVINREFLRARLHSDAADEKSAHDFGRDIIPAVLGSARVHAYPFEDVETRAQAYWRDVGTVDAYYDANLELVHVSPELNLYDEAWPIWTYQQQGPGAKFVLDDEGRRGHAINSMVAGGCIVSGAVIRESLLFSGVMVDECSEVYRSVILPEVEIGRNCQIHRAIVDEGCIIPHGLSIGKNRVFDETHFEVTDKGVVLVTSDMLARLRGVTPPATT
jgi:glucose-1-phosphate adenylyltransferase